MPNSYEEGPLNGAYSPPSPLIAKTMEELGMAAYGVQLAIDSAESPSSLSHNALTPTSSNSSVQMNPISPTDLCRALNTPDYGDPFNLSDYQSPSNPSTSPSDHILSEIFSNYPSPSNQIDTNSQEPEYDDLYVLKILAEPKAKYRERYESEIDPRKNRAHRFIRTEDDNQKYEYPTVLIPEIWRRNPLESVYIRVTLVTVTSEKVPVHCIHPYPIDTIEKDVIKDSHRNSLFFRTTIEEMQTGEKSFRITRKKLTQAALRFYGLLRLLDSDEFDVQRVQNLQDAKQLIEMYQLGRSQLVFTIAKPMESNSYPVPIPLTNVISIISTDVAFEARRPHPNLPNNSSVLLVKCIPSRCNWDGGEEVVLIFPYAIKHKNYDFLMDFAWLGFQLIENPIQIDTKTVLLTTPGCPLPKGDQDLYAELCIKHEDSILTKIGFTYIRDQRCTECVERARMYKRSNKRSSCAMGVQFNDGGESLVKQLSRLSLSTISSNNAPRTTSIVKAQNTESKYEAYCNNIGESIAEYVRTKNPSSLFRRTRLLLSKCEDSSPPLHIAIERGHNVLSKILVEQTLDMPNNYGLLNQKDAEGQTPLLVAARFNRWPIIKIILENRLDLLKQIDKKMNNIFHILAANSTVDTIKNCIEILSDPVKTELLTAKNQDGQQPVDIATSLDNHECRDLLKIAAVPE